MTWLWTISRDASSAASTDKVPTRSRYRPKFLEQEFDTIISGTRLGEVSNDERVVVEAGRKSLVRHIDKRHKLPLDDDIGDCSPLVFARIESGGIVATGVQEHEITGRNLAERIQHLVNQNNVVASVVVGIRLEVQASAAEQWNVIRPGRITDPHVASGRARRIRLAATRRLPEPPGAWIVDIRFGVCRISECQLPASRH